MRRLFFITFGVPFLMLTGACSAEESDAAPEAAPDAVAEEPTAEDPAGKEETLVEDAVTVEAVVADPVAETNAVVVVDPLSATNDVAAVDPVSETNAVASADPVAPVPVPEAGAEVAPVEETNTVDIAANVAAAVAETMKTNQTAVAAAVESAVATAAETNTLDIAAVVAAAAKAVEEARLAAETAAKELEEAKAEAAIDARRIHTRVFKLAHASAEDVAERFNATWTGDFGVKWKVTKIAHAFPGANSVMVTAPKMILEACEEVIRTIDVESKQVYIEARFVELSNNASHKLGIDWQMLDGMKGSLALDAGWNERKIEGVSEFNSSDGSYKLSSDAADTGRKSANLSYVNGTIGMSELSVILRALETSQDARTFSNPKIIVSSGKKAEVDMTEKYPNVTISAKRTTSGANSSSLDLSMNMAAIPGEDKFMFAKEAFFSWGIELEVTPRVSTNGLINVSIVPTISSQTGWVTAGASDTDKTADTANAGTYSAKYPVINVQRLITEFNLKSGTTAVIGGLSRTIETQKDTGIPWLRDWWWIGPRLFGSKERIKEQREIIVFVTVGFVDPKDVKKDTGLPKNAVLGRQYTEGIRREPGDRIRQGSEGMRSLDLRTLEEQYADPRRTNYYNKAAWKPFAKDPNYKTKKQEKQ